MRLVKITFLFLFLFYITLSHAQNKRLMDSLYAKLSVEKLDTVRSILLCDLSNNLYTSFPDSAFSAAILSYDLAKEGNYKFGKARALFCMGVAKQYKGKYDEALNYVNQALSIWKELPHRKNIGTVYNTIGLIYLGRNEPPLALKNFYIAIKEYQNENNLLGQAMVNGNVGLVYSHEDNLEKFLEYTTLAMNLDKSAKNEVGVARHAGNIGNVYYRQGKVLREKGDLKGAHNLFIKAVDFYNQALEMNEKQNSKSGMAREIGNLANVFNALGDTAKTTAYYNKSYKIFEEMGDVVSMSRQVGNIGWSYVGKKDYKRAAAYTKKAIELVKNTDGLDLLYNWYDNLSYIYELDENYKDAYLTYQQFIILRDSLFSIDKAKKTLEAQLNFEFEKKEALTKEEQAKQTIIRNAFIAGFALMFIMAIIVLRGYRNKQKANKLISEQKELVEEKNKEITDSIRYAKRIQTAHLPSDEYITKKMTELKGKG